MDLLVAEAVVDSGDERRKAWRAAVSGMSKPISHTTIRTSEVFRAGLPRSTIKYEEDGLCRVLLSH